MNYAIFVAVVCREKHRIENGFNLRSSYLLWCGSTPHVGLKIKWHIVHDQKHELVVLEIAQWMHDVLVTQLLHDGSFLLRRLVLSERQYRFLEDLDSDHALRA